MLENIPKVTRNLLIINFVMFIGTLLNEDVMMRYFALFYPTSQLFHWW